MLEGNRILIFILISHFLPIPIFIPIPHFLSFLPEVAQTRLEAGLVLAVVHA